MIVLPAMHYDTSRAAAPTKVVDWLCNGTAEPKGLMPGRRRDPRICRSGEGGVRNEQVWDAASLTVAGRSKGTCMPLGCIQPQQALSPPQPVLRQCA